MKLFFEKLFWAFAPIYWGLFFWFMVYGAAGELFDNIAFGNQLNILIRTLIIFGITILFFGKTFSENFKNNQLSFFGYSFWVPSWIFFMALAICSILFGFLFKNLHEYSFVQSLIIGVFMGATLEEFVARSFFVKYKMGLLEFIFFNLISSVAFTYMHSFYYSDGMSCIDLMANGHFGFSFMLGIIAYKTKRIEIPIILHLISNLLRYTIPVCLLNCQWPSIIYGVSSGLVEILSYLTLAGMTYTIKLNKN